MYTVVHISFDVVYRRIPGRLHTSSSFVAGVNSPFQLIRRLRQTHHASHSRWYPRSRADGLQDICLHMSFELILKVHLAQESELFFVSSSLGVV